jgi:hypothetical protein
MLNYLHGRNYVEFQRLLAHLAMTTISWVDFIIYKLLQAHVKIV